MSAYCAGCGRADMAGITHVCPPPSFAGPTHRCSPPTVTGLTSLQQPDWTCGSCGRMFRDMRGLNCLQWWAEIQGPREGVA